MQRAQVLSLIRELDPSYHNKDPAQPNKYLKKKKREKMRGEGGLGYNFRPTTLSCGGEGLSAQFGELESGVSKFP